VPFLARDRDDIGMARQNDATPLGRADRGEQIGLALAGAAPRRGDAVAAEIGGNPVDQI
jgi:hypothetical protein